MINYTFKIDMNNGNGLVNFTFPPFQENSDVARLGEELDSGFMIFWSKSSKQIQYFFLFLLPLNFFQI